MSIPLASFQMIEMAVFDTATLSGSFQPMNGPTSYLIFTGEGFQEDIKIMEMYNSSTSLIIISYDGVTRHATMAPGSTKIVDLQANHANFSSYGSGALGGRKGQIVWGMGTGTAGALYISGYR
jgi:hypothetical protein